MHKVFEKENFLEKALLLVGKKYDLLIIDSFLQNRSKRRFNQLLDDIPGINPRILSMRLKELERNRLLTKNLVFGTPVRTIYHLTDKAESLEKLILELKDWAKSN